MGGQNVIKLRHFNKSILILPIALICYLSMNTIAYSQDENFLISSNDYVLDSSPEIQSIQAESATISFGDSSNSPTRNTKLKSAHKYLGYASAALAGLTAATFSTGSFHEIAGYTTTNEQYPWNSGNFECAVFGK